MGIDQPQFSCSDAQQVASENLLLVCFVCFFGCLFNFFFVILLGCLFYLVVKFDCLVACFQVSFLFPSTWRCQLSLDRTARKITLVFGCLFCLVVVFDCLVGCCVWLFGWLLYLIVWLVVLLGFKLCSLSTWRCQLCPARTARKITPGWTESMRGWFVQASMREVSYKTIWIIESSFDDLSKYVDSPANYKASMREVSLQNQWW